MTPSRDIPDHCDVAVIGAGPCGSIAARRLARDGASVVLLDRAEFPRDKVCGCCLNQAALSLLSAEGLAGVIPPTAPRLNSIRLHHRARSFTIPTREGVALSRTRFDESLREAAIDAGACSATGISAQLIESTTTSHHIHLRGAGIDATLTARAVVCADGLSGTFLPRTPDFQPVIAPRARLGLGARLGADHATFAPNRILMAIADHGYAGLVRLEDASIDLAAAIDPDFLREHPTPGHAIDVILRSAGLDLPSLAATRFHGTPLLTRARPRLESGSLFIAGDAAGYVEPFTGEGMSWALASGLLAADAARKSLEDRSRSGDFTALLRRATRSRRLACSLVAGVLRRPALVSACFRSASVFPLFTRAIAAQIGRPFELPAPALP